MQNVVSQKTAWGTVREMCRYSHFLWDSAAFLYSSSPYGGCFLYRIGYEPTGYMTCNQIFCRVGSVMYCCNTLQAICFHVVFGILQPLPCIFLVSQFLLPFYT